MNSDRRRPSERLTKPVRPTTLPAPPSPRSHGLATTLKEHPVVVVVSLILSTVAIIVPIGITVTEKWNETGAIIDMGSVDQKKPFSAPLEIKNASTIFDMHSPSMGCKFSALYFNGAVPQITENGGTTGWHSLPTMSIAVKSSAIFFCDIPDKLKYTNEAGQELTLQSATLTVSTKYETRLLLWPIERQPQPTTFTLLNTSTGYQWVKGTLIK